MDDVEPAGPIVREPWGKSVARQVALWAGSVLGAVALFFAIQQLRPDPAVRVAADGRAPDFALPSTDGAIVRLSDLRGKKVVVNFWATWCAPCRIEAPSFASFARGNPDVVVLGIAVDSGSARELAAAKKRMDIPYPVLVADRDVSRAWDVDALPTTFVVDEEGRIASAQVGPMFGWQLALATR